MKARKFYLLILLLTGSVLLSSCETGLEPKVYDRISPINYPQNEADVTALVTGVYHALNTGAYGGAFADVAWQSRLIMNTATTDEFICFWGGGVWDTYRYFLWNSGSVHVWGKTYAPFIQTITNAVNTIEMIGGIEMNEELKRRYIAELKGIKALLAYTLYDFYGPVPIVVDPERTMEPDPNYRPDRPTKEWMIDYIKSTARAAANELPISYSSQDWGRITKGTALTVLLKLAMREHDWQEAIDISQEIMDLNFYELQDSYLSVFSVQNAMNNEIIFAAPNSVDGPENNWLAHVLPSAYEQPDGIPVQKWGGYKVPWEMYDKYEDNDNRLEAIWGEINTSAGMVDLRSIPEAWAQMGAVPYKYPADPAATGVAHGNDYVVYRYADVLLLRAEALNNIQPLTQESIDLINKVRSRAGTSLISANDFLSGDELNDFILDERFRELFHEGHRREDLIRHGRYIEEANKRGANIDDTRKLFPLPQWALDENPNIQQNPGY